MAQISGDWLAAVKPEFAKPYYRELYQFVTLLQGIISIRTERIPERHCVPARGPDL